MEKRRIEILKNLTSFSHAKLFNVPSKTKVKLRNSKKYGIELVCSKPIRKGEIVAYYKFKVFRDATYKGFRDNMYTMTVVSKKDNPGRTLVGGLYSGSLELPVKGKTFLAFFANEPSGKIRENCELDVELAYNYRHRKIVLAGDTMRYSLRATKPIKKGERIVWCYGEQYERKYKVNC